MNNVSVSEKVRALNTLVAELLPFEEWPALQMGCAETEKKYQTGWIRAVDRLGWTNYLVYYSELRPNGGIAIRIEIAWHSSLSEIKSKIEMAKMDFFDFLNSKKSSKE